MEILEHFEEQVASPGDFIIRKGDDAEEIYFLFRGHCTILIEAQPWGPPEVLPAVVDESGAESTGDVHGRETVMVDEDAQRAAGLRVSYGGEAAPAVTDGDDRASSDEGGGQETVNMQQEEGEHGVGGEDEAPTDGDDHASRASSEDRRVGRQTVNKEEGEHALPQEDETDGVRPSTRNTMPGAIKDFLKSAEVQRYSRIIRIIPRPKTPKAGWKSMTFSKSMSFAGGTDKTEGVHPKLTQIQIDIQRGYRKVAKGGAHRAMTLEDKKVLEDNDLIRRSLGLSALVDDGSSDGSAAADYVW